MNKNRIGGGAVLDELATHSEVRCYPKGGYVDAAVAQGRFAFLPGETCPGAGRQAEP